MARKRQGRQTTYSRKSEYVQGNVVRRLEVVPDRIEEKKPIRKLSHSTRKNRDKAANMNLGYVCFLTISLLAAAFILINYIRLQSEITNTIKDISTFESQLHSLKLENDEEYGRIVSSIDLEEVKRIAIEELGMKYAKEGQIVIVSGEGSDYVRQYTDLEK